MKVFIAGGTGAIGRVLVPLLIGAGHSVVALTRSADRAAHWNRWAPRRWSATCTTPRSWLAR